MLRHYLGISTLFFLTGCALGPQQPEASAAMSIAESRYGIVVGRMCSDHSIGPGISVLNLATKEEFNYFGAVNFAFRLPEGEYELFTIGAHGGAVASREPFRFNVQGGAIRYIGTFLYPWGGRDCQRKVKPFAVRPYQKVNRGFSGKSLDIKLQGSESLVSVVDEPDLPINDFRKQYPQHASIPIERVLAY